MVPRFGGRFLMEKGSGRVKRGPVFVPFMFFFIIYFKFKFC